LPEHDLQDLKIALIYRTLSLVIRTEKEILYVVTGIGFALRFLLLVE